MWPDMIVVVSPDAIDAPRADRPACFTKQGFEPAIAISAEPLRQGYDGRCQSAFIIHTIDGKAFT